MVGDAASLQHGLEHGGTATTDGADSMCHHCNFLHCCLCLCSRANVSWYEGAAFWTSRNPRRSALASAPPQRACQLRDGARCTPCFAPRISLQPLQRCDAGGICDACRSSALTRPRQPALLHTAAVTAASFIAGSCSFRQHRPVCELAATECLRTRGRRRAGATSCRPPPR